MKEINENKLERIAVVADNTTEGIAYLLLLCLIIFEIWGNIGMPALAEYVFFAINMILTSIAAICVTIWTITWTVDGMKRNT